MRIEVDVRKRVRTDGRVFDLEVAFDADSGRIAIYGPSGAGKSLTLQMIAGLIRPDAGRIVVDGETWFDAARGVDRKPRERRVGYLFQDYALFPHFTVRGNIAAAFGPRWPQRLSKAEHRTVERLLGRFGLDDVRASYPAQLSGGQRQRVALARALAGDPRRLLLDEPFAALDGMLRERLRDDLLALQAERGIPWIIITHDPDDVARCAEVVVPLNHGHVTKAAPLPRRSAGAITALA
jgi:molybdate transport system ATP-binding protein